jgi:anti-sigma regulatory factor (Ser/Thr protein kinase)
VVAIAIDGNSDVTVGRHDQSADWAMDGLTDSISSARERARAFLTNAVRSIPAATVDAVLLAVSELVTNAVCHAPGPYTLKVSIGEHRVRIAVTDSSPVTPVARTPRFDGSGGLGLHMLEALAGHVDIATHHGGGKTVSVDVAV